LNSILAFSNYAIDGHIKTHLRLVFAVWSMLVHTEIQPHAFASLASDKMLDVKDHLYLFSAPPQPMHDSECISFSDCCPSFGFGELGDIEVYFVVFSLAEKETPGSGAP
jgi:hypothetical protein